MAKKVHKDETFADIDCSQVKNQKEWQDQYDAAVRNLEKRSGEKGLPDEYIIINRPWKWRKGVK